MNILKLFSVGILALCTGTLTAFAQTGTAGDADFGYLTNILNAISGLLNTLLPLIIALAVIFFLWGLLKFMMAAGDESAKDEGKRIMIWGVVILFVMLSVWGLVAILNELTGIGQGGGYTDTPALPAPAAPAA